MVRMSDRFVHISCFKWGNPYSADDVNRLRAMFARHLTIPHTFHCLTDNPDGLRPDITVHPMPDYGFAPRDCGLGRKLAVYMPNFLGLQGKLLVQIDVDVVLTGNVDFLFDRPDEDFMIARGRNQAYNMCGHGAAMRLRVDTLPQLWTDFVADPESVVARCQHHRGAPGHVSQAPMAAIAHPGKLDANGCHHHRKTKDYHCHAAPDLDYVGVASVIDGDTIEIHGQRFRLSGIDAPETKQLCKDAEGKAYC